jgi:CTP:molybdopterin cytidylyltransferase MocA
MRPRNTPEVAGLVLAAGSGSRFGQPKAELVVQGRRLLDAAVDVLTAGGCAEVVAVVRAGVQVPAGVTAALNPEPSQGMGSSLRLGLATVRAEACVIVLVDQVGIVPSDIAAAIRRHREGAEIVVARRAGERSHPVLVGRAWYSDFAAAAVGDRGARTFLEDHPGQISFLDLSAQIVDIDTVADLDALS